LVNKDTKGFAREVLSILKMATQISSEYNVIDYLKPNLQIKKSEFGYKRIHSLLVIAFYQFESDFNSKNIFVRIHPTNLSAYVNYNTVQTILTHLFTNAFRYCKKNTEINIITDVYSNEYVEIKFLMRSLYLTDDILANGRLNGVRSEQAVKMHDKGTGMGLGIIQTLCALNKGSFDYSRVLDTKYNTDNYIYSDNCFLIRLLKEEFY
jgi:signal transduction histidine kinase